MDANVIPHSLGSPLHDPNNLGCVATKRDEVFADLYAFLCEGYWGDGFEGEPSYTIPIVLPDGREGYSYIFFSNDNWGFDCSTVVLNEDGDYDTVDEGGFVSFFSYPKYDVPHLLYDEDDEDDEPLVNASKPVTKEDILKQIEWIFEQASVANGTVKSWETEST